MQISDRLSNIKPSLTLSVNSRALELKAQGVSVTSLAVGEPDFPTPKHVCEAAKAAIDDNFCRYTAVPGIPELRKAAGAYFERNYGVPVPMESIVVGAGGKHCLYNFMQAMLNPGDEVLVPAPYWLSYPDMVMLTGATPVSVLAGPEQGFKVTPAMLEAHTTDKTKLLSLNSPSNPPGAVYTEAEFTAIMDWAIARGLFVLSDEIYDQLVFAPAKMTSAIGWFAKYPEQVAVLNGLSKSYAMTGWRIGYAAGPAKLIGAMKKIQSQSTSNPTSISQVAAEAALNGPQDVLEPMIEAFKRRHDLVMKGLNDINGISCLPADGAFYAYANIKPLIRAKGLKSCTEFSEWLLEETGVAVVPGDAFGLGGFMRISYATADEVLVDALARIKKAADSIDGVDAAIASIAAEK